MIAGIEMFLGVDGKQEGMKMTEYQMAANSIGVMRRLERNVDRRYGTLYHFTQPTASKVRRK